MHDAACAVASGEVAEDARDDGGLHRVDGQLPTLAAGRRTAAVAERDATDVMSAIELSSEAAMGFFPQVIEVLTPTEN
ncbi:MAG: hypothetical protein Q8K45_01065 [Rubrivivax sp.]|nr:hypothetical protein [Rubrivivax sp.]